MISLAEIVVLIKISDVLGRNWFSVGSNGKKNWKAEVH